MTMSRATAARDKGIMSEAQRQALSEANTGRVFTDEHRAKLAAKGYAREAKARERREKANALYNFLQGYDLEQAPAALSAALADFMSREFI